MKKLLGNEMPRKQFDLHQEQIDIFDIHREQIDRKIDRQKDRQIELQKEQKDSSGFVT